MKKTLHGVLLIALLVSATGCVSAMLGGKSGTRFQASVQDVYDASLSTLASEKLPVLQKSINPHYASIKSQYPEGTILGIGIKEVSPKYTEVNIVVEAVGDNQRAYDLMKKIESKVK